MSKGGFGAKVQVTSRMTMVGFGDSGAFLSGQTNIEMEGTITECWYRDLPERLPLGIKTFIALQIEFTEQPDRVQQLDIYTDDGDRYIGALHLRDRKYDKSSFAENDDMELRASISLLLPLAAFSQLELSAEQVYQLETVHDPIDDSTAAQKADHVIALIKRIYLQPVFGSSESGGRWLTLHPTAASAETRARSRVSASALGQGERLPAVRLISWLQGHTVFEAKYRSAEQL